MSAMLILAAADVHGSRAVYEWLLAEARAAAVEAIVLAGDLLGCPDGFATPEDAQRHDARGLVSLLETAGHPVFYVMGNDDLVELEPPPGSPVRSVHGCRAPPRDARRSRDAGAPGAGERLTRACGPCTWRGPPGGGPVSEHAGRTSAVRHLPIHVRSGPRRSSVMMSAGLVGWQLSRTASRASM